MARDEAFAAFVAARYYALVRTGLLLTGDTGYAEDLTQAALIRTYLAWQGCASQRMPKPTPAGRWCAWPSVLAGDAGPARSLPSEFLSHRRLRRSGPARTTLPLTYARHSRRCPSASGRSLCSVTSMTRARPRPLGYSGYRSAR